MNLLLLSHLSLVLSLACGPADAGPGSLKRLLACFAKPCLAAERAALIEELTTVRRLTPRAKAFLEFQEFAQEASRRDLEAILKELSDAPQLASLTDEVLTAWCSFDSPVEFTCKPVRLTFRAAREWDPNRPMSELVVDHSVLEAVHCVVDVPRYYDDVVVLERLQTRIRQELAPLHRLLQSRADECQALLATEFNSSRAARRLNISPSTLGKRMEPSERLAAELIRKFLPAYKDSAVPIPRDLVESFLLIQLNALAGNPRTSGGNIVVNAMAMVLAAEIFAGSEFF